MPRYFFIFIFFIHAFYCNADNGDVVYTSGVTEVKSLNTFVDEDGKLGINELVKFDFYKHPANFGITKNTIWVKLNIINKSEFDSLFIEIKNPALENVAFYSYSNGIVHNIMQSGSVFEFSKRWVQTLPGFLYPLSIKPNQTVTVFIRVKSNTPVHLPVSIGSVHNITQTGFKESLLSSFYFGIVVVMFFFNLFIFLSVRDESYLFYIFYIFFVGLAQLVISGYAAKYFWPGNQWLSANSFLMAGVFSGLATGVFTKNFLRTKYYTPLLDKVINMMIFLYVIGLILHFIGAKYFAFNLVNVLAAAGSGLIIYTAVHVVRQKYKPARYFLLAFSIFLLSVIIFVLRTFDILPYNSFTANILEIGSAIQITLLSFALADKINTYRKEQTAARREALIVSKENERLVREQNIVLEKEVKARTSELQKSNEELNEALVQLKTAQSKLVESEKMASLGQLTAGVAHEINNPINFVASNVKPLELDIQDIFDVLKKYENIDPAIDVHKQIQEIEDYKKEIDLDYIGLEIKSLLSGIKEGAMRTAEIVKNLKNFVRVDQSNLKFAHLNEGIESTLLLVRNTFPQNMVVNKHLGNINLVECAPGKINQVFMNIVTNAVQAMKAKQYGPDEQPTLTIHSEQQQSTVKISIKDNGVGMHPDVVTKIYEPFFTTKEVGEGTGLGMSIVKGIIDGHNGELQVFSEPGTGTEFILTIPEKSTIL